MEYDDYGWQRYESVGEKRAKAEKKRAMLAKKNPCIKPVLIEGSAIARSWWGKAWNANLERYSDYSNRIGRGRSYVRNGAVLDLCIEEGEIRALVQGSRARPYEVCITIAPLAKKTLKAIEDVCAGKLESVSELLEGKFPRALDELFTAKGDGLFPAPREIEFECSCPDWASMCKHVAAALYGVGARLDAEPSLFFVLRGIGLNDFVSRAVEHKSKALIARSDNKSSRVIEGADISAMFGIEFAATTPSPGRTLKHPPKAKPRKSKSVASARAKPVSKKAAPRKKRK
jgi:uncharacterized Zn finger protein